MTAYAGQISSVQPKGRRQLIRHSFGVRRSFRVFLLALGIYLPLAAQGILVPDQRELPNLDKRTKNKGGVSHLTTTPRQAIRQLTSLVVTAQVDEDEILGTPQYVRATRGLLTGPHGEGGGVSAKTAGAFAVNDPHRAVKGFLNEHTALFGYDAEALGRARLKREFVTAHNGMRSVVWEQQVDGIAVFGGVLVAHTTKRGELVSLSSGFVPEAQKAADAGAPNRKALIAAPTISAQQAVAQAAAQVDEKLQAQDVAPVDAAIGADQHQGFTAKPLLGKTGVKLVWLPINRSTMRLCWEVILTSRTRGEMFRILIDALTGESWLRHCLTDYISDASYRVFTSDSPSPFSPGHSVPLTNQPPVVPRQLVTWGALSTNASPAGWINDGENTTRGNNVDAHLDRDDNDVPDPGSRPTGSPFRVFDFPLNLNQEPVTYTNAAVAQLFYWNNWIHDRLYDLGFTEAAGNFQNDNFRRGGLGNDAVQADAQDGSGVNNANFSTPPDGSAPRMQMYLFDGPTPDRDGDLDVEIILHEYTHGLSNRRVGGGVGINALQSGGLGEGWSDFYALALLSEAADGVSSNYTAGGYVTYLLDGLTQNYYFGIRRYPYTTDMTKNPLTYKDIDSTQASPHPGVPRNPIIGNTADEVHNMGEVWCVTLWEARANLIHKWGYAVGNQLILQLVTDAMNLSPANPTYLQARDAILQADQVNHGGANQWELWSAFAKRGMGWSATSPDSSTTEGLVEAFNIPDDLSVTPLAGMNARGPVGGPFIPSSQTYTLANVGSNAISWTASTTAAWLDLSSAGGTLASGALPATVVVSISPTAASLPQGIYTSMVTFSNGNSGIAQSRTLMLLVGQSDYFTELFDTTTNDLAYQMVTFTPDGSSSFYKADRDPVIAFPTDPSGGMPLSLGDDDFVQVMLLGVQVCLFGVNYPDFFVGSNGYITFGSGDKTFSEFFSNHFNRPRISALFDDLDPTAEGLVSWKQLDDRVAVTFERIPEYGSGNPNNFQIEIFFNGVIRLTFLGLGAKDGLIGLSRGAGIPDGFMESDISSYGPSDVLQVSPFEGLEFSGYQGGPFSPSSRVYTLTNVGTGIITWVVTHTQSWLDVSLTHGTLGAGGSTNVTVSMNTQANALAVGAFFDPVIFQNTCSGFGQARTVGLVVREVPGEIKVLDSISPQDDTHTPFGDVIVGVSHRESFTVTNLNALHDLVISDIGFMEYREDFNDGLAPEWDKITDVQWDVVAGEYRAQNVSDIEMQSVYTGKRWQDCVVGVTMRRTGDMYGAQTLLVRASDDFRWVTPYQGSGYDISIDGNGKFYVGKTVDGNWNMIQDWIPSPYLNVGTMKNDVCVDAQGMNLRVYFNGHLAWQGTDTEIQGPGWIGLAGLSGNGQVNFFDDVSVTDSLADGLLTGENTSMVAAPSRREKEIRIASDAWKARGMNAPILNVRPVRAAWLVNGPFQLENVPATPYRLPAGAELKIEVVFEPRSLATNQAVVTIQSNDADEPVVQVQLSGAGVPDSLQVHTVIVETAYGVAGPAAGSHVYQEGVTLTNRLNGSPEIHSTTQYISAGWSLLGHVAANGESSGTGTQVVITVTNQATLIWLWRTNYGLHVEAGLYGSVDITNGWYAKGSVVTGRAEAEPYYHFTHWSGTVTGSAVWENPLSMPMDGPKSLSAWFAENVVTNRAPEWWFARYGLTNGGLSFSEAAMCDADGDGAISWEEYWANTDPTDPRSVFTVQAVAPNNEAGYVVGWTGGSERLYSIFFSTNKAGGGWSNLASGLSSPAGRYTDTVNRTPSMIWYRGGVCTPSPP